jgi:hypothetical protein
MKNLVTLNGSSYGDCLCGISNNNNNIKNLNLKILNASYNNKITNINHMQNLTQLCASGNCGLSDETIKKLNLKIILK